jgi:chromosome segregation ATPase
VEVETSSNMPQWVQNIASGLAGVGAASYLFWRRIRGDNHNDKIDDKAQQLINSIAKQLEDERKRCDHLGTVIDRVSKERNDAVRDVGRLEGAVASLQGEVTHLRQHIEGLELQITSMSDQFKDSMRLNAELLATLRAQET